MKAYENIKFFRDKKKNIHHLPLLIILYSIELFQKEKEPKTSFELIIVTIFLVILS